MRVQLCYTDAARREGALKQCLPKIKYPSFIRPHSFVCIFGSGRTGAYGNNAPSVANSRICGVR